MLGELVDILKEIKEIKKIENRKYDKVEIEYV